MSAISVGSGRLGRDSCILRGAFPGLIALAAGGYAGGYAWRIHLENVGAYEGQRAPVADKTQWPG